MFSAHQLIGATKIDLEDRWFHRKWQALGHSGAPGFQEDEGLRSSSTSRSPLKPLELRDLYTPGVEVPQGQLEMWLEILPLGQSREIHPTEIFGPPTKKFYLRLICWKAEGVPRKCGHDLYTTFQMAAPHASRESTDIHFACKDGEYERLGGVLCSCCQLLIPLPSWTGNPSWNYRIVIPIELPLRDPLHARLTVQLWDFDVLTANDIVAERQIDLYQWFLMAYHSEREVQPFKVMKQARADRDTPPPSQPPIEKRSKSLPDTDSRFADCDLEDEAASRLPLLGVDVEQPHYSTAAGTFGKEQSNPLVSDENSFGEKTDEEDDENLEHSDPIVNAQDALDALLNLVGMGPLADDAMWLKLVYFDQKKKKARQRGRLALSLCIVPEVDVQSRPAGKGRSEPNANPFLPPPVGRVSFSFNPCTMIRLLVPFEILCCLGCCVIGLVLAAVFLYGGSYYVTFQTWADHI